MSKSRDSPQLRWLAGLAVRCNRQLRECPTIEAEGWDLDLVFRLRSRVEAEPIAVDDSEWLRLPAATGLSARLRIDGRSAVIEEPDAGQIDHDYEARRVAPFAAALHGLVVLHAGAVESDGQVYAVVGGTGVGKSTLVEAFGREGLALVAEDLLPCRITPGRLCALTLGPNGRPEELTLSGLNFLERREGLAQPERRRLGSVEVVQELLRHGFGELEAPRIWARQFEAYGRMAQLCAGFRLLVPEAENEEQLTRLTKLVAELLFQGDED